MIRLIENCKINLGAPAKAVLREALRQYAELNDFLQEAFDNLIDDL